MGTENDVFDLLRVTLMQVSSTLGMIVFGVILIWFFAKVRNASRSTDRAIELNERLASAQEETNRLLTEIIATLKSKQ